MHCPNCGSQNVTLKSGKKIFRPWLMIFSGVASQVFIVLCSVYFAKAFSTISFSDSMVTAGVVFFVLAIVFLIVFVISIFEKGKSYFHCKDCNESYFINHKTKNPSVFQEELAKRKQAMEPNNYPEDFDHSGEES